jgi:hypothetical protein
MSQRLSAALTQPDIFTGAIMKAVDNSMNMGADHRRDAIRAYFKDQQDHLNG